MKRKKVDLHLWRMEKIIERINSHNELRQDLVNSGQAQAHPEWFKRWEAEELERQSRFEKLMETATP